MTLAHRLCFKGKTAVVTGGSKGIGAAIYKHLHAKLDRSIPALSLRSIAVKFS